MYGNARNDYNVNLLLSFQVYNNFINMYLYVINETPISQYENVKSILRYEFKRCLYLSLYKVQEFALGYLYFTYPCIKFTIVACTITYPYMKQL